MNPDTIGQLAHEALKLSILMSLPLVGAAAIVGLLFGFLQALTQLQDQTTTFAVKLVVLLGLLLVLLPWLSALAMAFGDRALNLILDLP
jgi:type III secretory pathway component EscS